MQKKVTMVTDGLHNWNMYSCIHIRYMIFLPFDIRVLIENVLILDTLVCVPMELNKLMNVLRSNDV